MRKKWFAFFSVVLFVGAIGLYYTFFIKSGELTTIDSFEKCVAAGFPILESYPAQCKTNDGKSFTESIGNEAQMQETIRISSPRPNQLLINPVTITGEAKGTWFFEAQAPVKLVDQSGEVIAAGIIHANEDWMTEKFVSFSGELQFKNPPSPKATLILEKDNPSGDPAKAQQLTIPVYLK